MIPLPVSTPHRRFPTRLYLRPNNPNTRLLLLLLFLSISLFFNVLHYSFSSSSNVVPSPSLLATVTRDKSPELLSHLIIVPCHAVWVGMDPNLRLSEDQWLLEPYQMGSGRLAAFFAHISKGVELAVRDKHALLIFSGGQTKKASTTTEAESYLRLALSSNIASTLAVPGDGHIRATTENYALDSYQNLLFSIARFYEYTGHFPDGITLIGYEFKRQRFEELHRAAIRWPIDRFHYIGVDGEIKDHFIAHQGEFENGYIPYLKDLYGCHSFLASKRRRRNPHLRFPPYIHSTPHLAFLLNWCPGPTEKGASTIFAGDLPWDH
ncbi:hypothetical protein AMATHDRAFT_74551 [Amanita thiersii Skay4041]|uniref:DUF218 domain-containing protein n=1 Tax=Amanita thiersii Skay4041 TaxID=703135 RepID=A0A2A9NWG8_9AGAR|nr:hypothetical protein AMATHDRAFT_74551 [Amanita thiersii Skay4041]